MSETLKPGDIVRITNDHSSAYKKTGTLLRVGHIAGWWVQLDSGKEVYVPYGLKRVREKQ